MLSITDFANEIRKEIINYLPEEYQQAECMIETMIKNNGIPKKGLVIRLPENHTAPILYLDSFYQDYQQGFSMSDILSELSKVYIQEIQRESVLSVDPMVYENVKAHITLKLINHKANSQLLRQIPHKDVEDLSSIYQISLSDFQNKASASIKVTNQFMDSWGINIETLHQIAIENSMRLEPPTFKSMTETMGELIMKSESAGNLFKDREAFLQAEPDMMYVLTNRNNFYGASALLYPKVMAQISEVFPEGFYILPSSVHEVLIMPKPVMASPQELGKMVRDINQQEITKEEFLSDRIYEYNKDTKEFHHVTDSLKKERGMER